MLPKIALVAGPSAPLGTSHQQPQDRQRKLIDSGRVQKVLKVNDGRVVTLRALRSGGQHVDHR